MNHNTQLQIKELPPVGSQIYLMGICGTGMAALAGLLTELGYNVRGSDSAAYPPMSLVLERLGIDVTIGYTPENLKNPEGSLPALIIIGNVIRADNPEAQAAVSSGVPYISFPQAIELFFLKDRNPLVVAGTHGKTTTSTMLVSALDAGCSLDPGFMIGGMLQGYDAGFNKGSRPWFVLEGDEYDTAFFDKGPKFMHYRPFGAILTSIEFDHADIFQDIEAVKRAFRGFTSIIHPEGVLVACSQWPAVREVCNSASSRVVWYGDSPSDDWQLKDVKVHHAGTTFQARRHGTLVCQVDIPFPGMHNALNALAVLALGTELGLEPEDLARGLSMCRGVKRRQEVRGEPGGITVIDDFAHHPSAVKVTIEALKAKYDNRRLIVVFEPRTNTSRRSVFQERYSRAFDRADMVIVRSVPDPEKAPEGDRFSSEKLAQDISARGIDARCLPDATAILETLLDIAEKGDVIAIFSNGAFEGLHQRLLEGLAQLHQQKL